MALFACEVCQAEDLKPSDRGRIDEPTKCTACGSTMTMKLLHNRSYFNNKQLIKMQVGKIRLPPGDTLHYHLCHMNAEQYTWKHVRTDGTGSCA